MKRAGAIAAVLLIWVLLPGVVLAAEAPAAQTLQPDTLSVRHAYVDAYSKTASTGPEPYGVELVPVAPEAEMTPLQQRLEAAGAWLKLMDVDEEADLWEASRCDQSDSLARPNPLCGVRWRKNDGYTALRGRFEDLSTDMKSRVVGKSLAERLEVDIDSSPEIKLRWDWK